MEGLLTVKNFLNSTKVIKQKYLPDEEDIIHME